MELRVGDGDISKQFEDLFLNLDGRLLQQLKQVWHSVCGCWTNPTLMANRAS